MDRVLLLGLRPPLNATEEISGAWRAKGTPYQQDNWPLMLLQSHILARDEKLDQALKHFCRLVVMAIIGLMTLGELFSIGIKHLIAGTL